MEEQRCAHPESLQAVLIVGHDNTFCNGCQHVVDRNGNVVFKPVPPPPQQSWLSVLSRPFFASRSSV